jgi:ABC-type transporter Mla subunit MlaD
MSSCRWVGVLSLLALAVGCERTAEGVKQDTQALAASAERGAADTKQSLSGQVDAFKAESQRALDKLSASLNELGSKAEGKADESREDLKRQLAETKQSLDNVSARTEAELEETRQTLKAKIAELGRQINSGLDKAGDATEKALQ